MSDLTIANQDLGDDLEALHSSILRTLYITLITVTSCWPRIYKVHFTILRRRKGSRSR
jgi:hypothetical protein